LRSSSSSRHDSAFAHAVGEADEFLLALRRGADSILLVGVSGIGENRITQSDFLWSV
jgi:hypothetical protein